MWHWERSLPFFVLRPAVQLTQGQLVLQWERTYLPWTRSSQLRQTFVIRLCHHRTHNDSLRDHILNYGLPSCLRASCFVRRVHVMWETVLIHFGGAQKEEGGAGLLGPRVGEERHRLSGIRMRTWQNGKTVWSEKTRSGWRSIWDKCNLLPLALDRTGQFPQAPYRKSLSPYFWSWWGGRC